MSLKDPLFRKGSLIPAVLDLEADLVERERAARAEAGRIVREARVGAERLIAETGSRLPDIEAGDRAALADSLAGSADSLKAANDAEIAALEARIAAGRRRAHDYILSRLAPVRDDENGRSDA